MTFRVELRVTPKAGVRDPQGEAVGEALAGLGFANQTVRHVGRILELDITAASDAEARTHVDEMCRRLLVNPNLETYSLHIEPA